MTAKPTDSDETNDEPAQDARVYCADGWTARVIKNEDDDGWAVAMTADGALEPSLVGPWTMGRDKKNPKPLDASSFAVLLRGANEILARHAQQRRAQLHRTVMAEGEEGRVRVDLGSGLSGEARDGGPGRGTHRAAAQRHRRLPVRPRRPIASVRHRTPSGGRADDRSPTLP